MSRFTETLAQHQTCRHPRAATDFVVACTCGWDARVDLDELEYEPDKYRDAEPILVARFAAHVESMLVEAGVVAVELPEADEGQAGVITPPTPPEPPVYEDLSTIPDLQCEWDEEGWESNYHQGLRCKVCDEMTECEMCNKGVEVRLNCLRNQAEDRNFDRRRAHEKALEAYQAQADYYNALAAAAVRPVNPEEPK